MTSDADTLHPPPDALARAGFAIERVRLRYGDFLVPLLITAVAGFLRFWRLSTPHSIVPLDETYYAPNAFGYLCHGVDMTFAADAPHTCDGLEPAFAVHPPVGKLLIAIGIKIFGYRPFGWRFMPALVGTLIVLLAYLIGRRLWPEKRWPAAAAAILVAADGLLFVQARLAMLDIFLAFFIVLGVWLLLEDRARATEEWTGPRWWRLGAGVALGLAVASKWAAIPMLPVVGAVALAWEAVRIRTQRDRAAESATPGDEASETLLTEATPESPQPSAAGMLVVQALKITGTFLLIPALVYLASYTPWFLSTKRYVPPRCTDKAGMSLWYCNQKEIYDYHRNLPSFEPNGAPKHPYMSRPWSWPWISRPASHYNARYCLPSRAPETSPGVCPRGDVFVDEEILGLPNPVIWWTAFFIALPACIFWTVKRLDETAALLVVLFAPLVLPWFIYSRPLFLFYMAPASFFLTLMVVHAMVRWRWRKMAVVYVAIAVAAFGYFYPVLAAYPLPLNGAFSWNNRMWFGHNIKGDCLSAKIKLFCWI